MNSSFEYISTLQYRLKAANDKLGAFETGEKYVQMENNFWGIIRRLEARIKDLEAEVARAHAETVTVRNHWMEVIEDLNKEAERDLRSCKRKQKQAVSFRSFESIDHLCQCMSMLLMMRKKEGLNIFNKVAEIFG